MPRRSSSSHRSSSHGSSSHRSSQPHQMTSYTGPILPRPPTQVPSSQPPVVTQQQSQYQYPSFGQIVKEGFGFGIGSSIANRVVSSVLGPTQQSQPIQVSSQETKREPVYSVAYNQCVLEGGNHEVCKQYLDNAE